MWPERLLTFKMFFCVNLNTQMWNSSLLSVLRPSGGESHVAAASQKTSLIITAEAKQELTSILFYLWFSSVFAGMRKRFGGGTPVPVCKSPPPHWLTLPAGLKHKSWHLHVDCRGCDAAFSEDLLCSNSCWQMCLTILFTDELLNLCMFELKMKKCFLCTLCLQTFTAW